MAAGFIWFRRDGHVRVPRLLEPLLDNGYALPVPIVDEQLPGTMLSLAKCCLVRCVDVPYTSVLLTLTSSRSPTWI